MGKPVTFTAEYKGQTFTRTSKTMAYTHVVLVKKSDGSIVAARWSNSARNAANRLGYGLDAMRVAVVPVTAGKPAPKAKAAKQEAPAAPAPAADTELCASNSRAKGMHLRVKGQQVSLCGKAKTSRKPNAPQLADNKVCTACAGH